MRAAACATSSIDAASELIAESGTVDAVSLRAVARRAGVSAPSVYLHFDDRDGADPGRRRAPLPRPHPLRPGGARAARRRGRPRGRAARRHPRLRAASAWRTPATTACCSTRTRSSSPFDEAGPRRRARGLRQPRRGHRALPGRRPGPPGRRLRAGHGHVVGHARHGAAAAVQAAASSWPPLEDMLEDVLVGLVGIPPAGTTRDASADRRVLRLGLACRSPRARSTATTSGAPTPARWWPPAACRSCCPAVDGDEERAAGELVARLDGLVLAGGTDIMPATYGRDFPMVQKADPARDRFEVALVRAADRVGLPVLGICRGMELLNVARGGTLHEQVAHEVPATDHGTLQRRQRARARPRAGLAGGGGLRAHRRARAVHAPPGARRRRRRAGRLRPLARRARGGAGGSSRGPLRARAALAPRAPPRRRAAGSCGRTRPSSRGQLAARR